MNNNFGVMQGRLLPKFKDQYQSHPLGYWQKEYDIASKLFLKNIEFIFDLYLYNENPIYSNLEEIINIQKKTGITTSSICADFFMNAPIQSASGEEKIIFKKIISKLIKNLSKLGGSDIVIPFVDNSKLKNREDKEKVIEFLNSFEEICSDNNINLSLETDLEPKEFRDFIDAFDNNFITINYDSGNSASLGYSIFEELNILGNKITNIHIKDRLLNGFSVELGKGNANLKLLKKFIIENNYDGVITFQAYRDKEGISIFKKQYQYFLDLKI